MRVLNHSIPELLYGFGEKEACERLRSLLLEFAWICLRMRFDAVSSNDLFPVFDHRAV
jgi:hypothetical protein